MGVYQAAEALGLEVPRDCSIIGVDDLEIVAAALDPGLTTIALPHREMGRWGMRSMLDRIEGREVDAAAPLLLAGTWSSAARSRRPAGPGLAQPALSVRTGRRARQLG